MLQLLSGFIWIPETAANFKIYFMVYFIQSSLQGHCGMIQYVHKRLQIHLERTCSGIVNDCHNHCFTLYLEVLLLLFSLHSLRIVFNCVAHRAEQLSLSEKCPYYCITGIKPLEEHFRLILQC